MKPETVKTVREYGYFGSLGLQVALSIIIGFFGGRYLDRQIFPALAPWCSYIGLAMGIVAGFRNIGLAIQKIRKY